MRSSQIAIQPPIERPLTAASFPEPDSDSIALSHALVERVREELDAGAGWLSFERYMQLALHEPGLGYYSAGSVKLGPAGDFTTAPELSSLLAAALAPFIREVLTETQSSEVLELGAGSGRLAAQLLSRLDDALASGIRYSILETSADLADRQRTQLAPWAERTRWIERLPPSGFEGVVIANEVADAIPVARFVKTRDGVLPLGVVRHGRSLAIEPGPADDALSAAVAEIERELGFALPEGYRSEVGMTQGPWLTEVLGAIRSGGLLLIDYGMSRRDYYRPERSDGTLMCHYRHRAHPDPLLWPGLQDITAWVDFSALARTATRLGFSVSGFTTQAQFLVETMARNPELAGSTLAAEGAAAMQRLVLPGEMGERFKLIWLTTDSIATSLPGRDFRSWL